MFKRVTFLLSAPEKGDFPNLKTEDGKGIPEVAFVGKSNVGKSSLLNHLTQNRKLAHISSKPGKTRLVNFFTLDNKLTLVDLPGYGFAKVSKKMRQDWGALTDDYLHERENLQLILHLIDARHPPTKHDLAFVKWVNYFQKPWFTIFTKADKLSREELESQCRKSFALLTEAAHGTPSAYVVYSIKDAKARIHLMKAIKEHIGWD